MPESLSVDIRVSRGSFHLRVAHDFQPGRTTAVIGPNGAGKSTLLEALAGLQPAKGTVTLGNRVLSGPASRPVAPHLRKVGLLAQNPLLFPHLSILDNITFGPRSRGVARAAAEQTALEWAERLDLRRLLSLRPRQLSGGQRGRAALARALAAAPRVLLLDEPSAALDVDSAAHFRTILLEQLRDLDLTVILVSHTAEDVVALADTLMVIEEGAVTDCGPAIDRLRLPRRDFTARLLGLNRFAGEVRGDRIACEGVSLQGVGAFSSEAGAGWAAIEPHLVRLWAGADEPNSWETQVAAVNARGGGIAVSLEQPAGVVAHLSLSEFDRLQPAVGDTVRARIAPEDLRIYL